MIIHIISCLLMFLSGISWKDSGVALIIKIVFYVAAMYNGFEAYRFYIMGV